MSVIAQRVVVADDHPLCRSGLASLLSDRFRIGEIVQASDFPHTLAAVARSPDATMLTVNMNLPSMNGTVGLRRLRADYPSLRLVVVANSHARETVLETLCAGVHGYIPKDTPTEEMFRALESILAGQIYVPPLVCEATVTSNAPATKTPNQSSAALTSRQIEVLKLVAAGRSNKEIARLLLIAEGTVKVHVAATFRALGVRNRISAAAALQTRSGKDPPHQFLLPGLLATNHAARSTELPSELTTVAPNMAIQ